MSLGRYGSPPPQPPAKVEDLVTWVKSFVAWLTNEQSDPADTLEDDFLFGGEAVANRMFGFEGVDTPTIPEDVLLMAAPAAGKKTIITDLVISSTETATGTTLRLYKKKAAVEYNIIPQVDVGLASAYVHTGRIILDETDEALWMEVTVGTLPVAWVGSYLAVD